MKFRQAEKIVKKRFNGWLLYNDPSLNKAIVVYIHHKKKSNPRFYEIRGIIKELRNFYEGKKQRIHEGADR